MKEIVIVRGGGDIASGVIQKLYRCGFKVLVLEIENPTCIRRAVSFSEALFENEIEVEGIKSVRVRNLEEIEDAWKNNKVPVIVDPKGSYINLLKPKAVVDGILAKKNLGTYINMAPITIALGPGFEAGKDVNVVIETNRGHNLGRLIFNGEAQADTGAPGNIGGYTKERVIYGPCDGVINNVREIGDIVKKEEPLAYVGDYIVRATIDGVLRGIIRNNSKVYKGLKIADIDPRLEERKNCFTISDKARTIGGGVLEALIYLIRQ
ncbi:selenium-dependent molybdenum cofactor biosynthesis protein YqeB [Clostridium intestinale]|uniref:Selenium-dependent molybdenum hydroxylase system protein, YqeB family n=1 Tax=Clostridium intestinale URNW TaxID=1294142 RepID=U2NJ25_9CLOT|nr:selenium-dependent molybdenum cofactor biosynthesis protein YqeB [Clostridium intestinale]ERK29138.1 selenium-dependent molybdenum hydroxylase system protein, YqeB family [Clostridium intestinale URNW]